MVNHLKRCAVKAACRNVDNTMGIQVPDEPLELSIVGHPASVSSMLLKGAMRRKHCDTRSQG